MPENYQPRFKSRYHETVGPKLREEFGYSNMMMTPRLEKIILNTSLKDGTQNVKILESAAEELTLIAGQKAVIPMLVVP